METAVRKQGGPAGEWHSPAPSRALPGQHTLRQGVCTSPALHRQLTQARNVGRYTGAGLKESLGANSSNSIKS